MWSSFLYEYIAYILSMLYEKSRVSKYARKDRPGKVKTQINLGLNSEFEKDKEVVVLYLEDFEDIEEQIQNPTGDQTQITELETKIQNLDTENTTLKEEIKSIPELEKTITELTQENLKLQEEAKDTSNLELEEKITQLNTSNESLEKEKDELTTKNNELNTEKETLKEKITELEKTITEINPVQLKETISALKAENEILKENNKRLDEIPYIVDLQEQHRYEINKLNSKLIDEKDHVNRLMVGIIDMFNRGALNRFRNTIPDSLKEAMDEKLITGEKKLVNAAYNNDTKDN